MNVRDVAAYVAVVYLHEEPTLYGPFETLNDAEQWLSWGLPIPLRSAWNRVEPVLRVAP